MPLADVVYNALALGVSTLALAQTNPLFEVASIKPSRPPEPNQFGFPVASSIRIGPDGKVIATQATLRDLIRRAYDLPDFLMTGLLPWMTSDRFDVVARPEAGFLGRIEQIQTMLRELLTERFMLRAHTETRELWVYHLVLARRDRRLGPQLRPSTLDCAAVRAKRGPSTTPPPDGSEPACRPLFKVSEGSMTLRFQGETMAEFARRLIPQGDRPVLDRTGLAGTFDGELTFAPEPPPGFPRLPGSENGVSVFTAIQEQLGLKLEPERGLVDILVIASARKPTDN
jgi:uncharacterized protein (TIGR03435 family)